MRSSIADEPQLLEPGNGSLGEALAAEVGERRPAPQLERLVQTEGRLLCLTGGERRSPILDEPLETPQVEVVVLDPHEIAGEARGERVASDHTPETVDVRFDQARGGGARLLAPELLGEQLRGDDLAGVEEQKREQRALPIARELNWSAVAPDFERAKNRKLHRSSPQQANVARKRDLCRPTAPAVSRRPIE